MGTGEQNNGPEQGEGITHFERRWAESMCDRIEEAARLTQAAKVVVELAARETSDAVGDTLMERRFKLRVTIPGDVPAHVSRKDEMIEEQPVTFMATALVGINEHGVEFYDQNTDRRLRIRGYDFEVGPVFEEAE